MKRFLWFLLGLILGVAGTLGYLKFANDNGPISKEDYQMTFFEQPKEEMSSREYQVIQAWPNGTALAMDFTDPLTVVLLWNKKHEQYYDGQTVKAGKNQVFRHIGICRYNPADENINLKTVPIVELTNK